tara:strand:+ start:820 stop:981 length:162 start_codon:yes stop_codon:yes gene_type:complete
MRNDLVDEEGEKKERKGKKGKEEKESEAKSRVEENVECVIALRRKKLPNTLCN